MSQYVVAAMYHFVNEPLEDLFTYKSCLEEVMRVEDIRGTFLLASEGLNGTIAGSANAVEVILDTIKQWSAFSDIKVKYAYIDKNPFLRAKVKLKKEIVTMGMGDVAVVNNTAEHLNTKAWDDMMQDPDCVVLDTRNAYEVQIGTFKGAVNPDTDNFREFPEFVERTLGADKNKKIAMFCTGGIRCEKASAYMREQGYTNVYQLDGGVLKYLEDKNGQDSLWEGDCFVFDNRVAVDKNLNKSKYGQCFACRRPITEMDKQHTAYVAGVSCHQCIDQYNASDRKRFAQRQKQMQLAKKRGENHLGVNQRSVDEVPS